MLLYAINQDWVIRLFLFGSEVKRGEVWRLVTWPLMNPPTSVLVVLTLLFFWFVGHQIEERVGRKRFTVFLLFITVLPAAIMSLVAPVTTYDDGLYTLGTALLAVLALMEPNMRFISASLHGCSLSSMASSTCSSSPAIGCGGRSACCCSDRSGHPVDALDGLPRGIPVGPEALRSDSAPWPRACQAPSRRRRSLGRQQHRVRGRASSTNSSTRSARTGMSSLSKAEKERLNELSKRLRGT